ncbi:hypothetical protein B6N60_02382 [Richelia sinica FACHB-800]|uniref:Uncharacterized protein n=1 Tax=Richelia sinica FACHB-800 TaxID=1357546 RepID=A0A975T7Q8_9NOST|nr:hypothetical protein B6N60_02382 [Richelia sinica FACHB-800]
MGIYPAHLYLNRREFAVYLPARLIDINSKITSAF